MVSQINKLILGFVGLIIGAVLISSIATSSNDLTDKKAVANEAITITTARYGGNFINSSINFTVAKAPTGWKSQDCPLTSYTLGNASTDFTETTDYVLNANTGVLYLKNTTITVLSVPNTTYIDYTYCGDDYMNLSWGRTSMDVTIGLFAVAILLFSVGMFYSVAKESGIIGR